MFYITGSPFWLKGIFPRGLTWQGPRDNGRVYLTFDDGPEPGATPFVLDQLAAFGAKATFFCIGENILRYPDLFARITAEGHRVANHTMTHPNGWHISTNAYLKEVLDTHQLVQTPMFRPPYGRITRRQVCEIRRKIPGMEIVMWSAVTGDFDVTKSGEWCARVAIRHAKPGNILVFHDSEKAFPRLKVALPATLKYLVEKGWEAAPLGPPTGERPP